MGRPYTLFGQVIRGKKRGRELGFPTANIDPGDQIVPGEGIYAGWCSIQGRRHVAAVSIGHNPTFGIEQLSVEAYVLDFDGDIYDQTIQLEFARWIRGQEKFDSPDALAHQIREDIEQVRDVCKAVS